MDLGAQDPPKRSVFIFSGALFTGLGASWGQDSPKSPPRALQEPPKSLQEPSKRALGIYCWSIVDRFWIFFGSIFLIDLTHPQARWRGWPAGQLDISAALPLGRAWRVELFIPSSCQFLFKIFKILFRLPSAPPEIAENSG